MRCWIPNAYILDITMYKMHVSLCSYYTIRILISNTLTGTCEGGYTYVFEMCCYRTLDIVIYTVIYMYIYICKVLLCLTDTSLYIYICVKHVGMANIKKKFRSRLLRPSSWLFKLFLV